MKSVSVQMVVLTSVLSFAVGCGWSADRPANIYENERLSVEPAAAPASPEERTQEGDGWKSSDNGSEGPVDESDNADDTLTLRDCLRRAIERSHRLRIQAERIYDQELRQRKAISTILPTARAHGRYEQDEAEVVVGGSSFRPQSRDEYWFTVKQPILNGEFFPAYRSSKITEKIERLNFDRKRSELLFRVASEFYRILQLEADVRALNTSLEQARQFRQIAESRREAGTVSREDVLSARARLNEVRALLKEARKERRNARSRLAELIDMKGERLPETVSDSYTPERNPGSAQQLKRRARTNNEELLRAKQEIDRAEQDVRRQKAAYLPTVDATFTDWTAIEGGFNERNDWTFTVDAVWTLFDGFGRETDVASAYSSLRRQRLERARVRDRVEREVEEALQEYRALEASLADYRRRAEAARETVEVVRSRYQAGEALNLDVLRAQETAESAERNYQRARYARKLASLRIRLSTGTLENTSLFDSVTTPEAE